MKKSSSHIITGLILLLSVSFLTACTASKYKKPLKVLLITGGCCHNYPLQTQALKDGLSKHSVANWTVVNEGGSGTESMLSLYDNPDWAKGYDVVVHNECFANTKSPEYIRKITKAHYDGTPAVVIHCAMHTYRATDVDDWRELLGVTSRYHDHQSNYPVKKADKNHSIIRDMPDNWVTPKDELYIIEKIWPETKVLASSVSEKDGKTHPVIWTSKYGKARVFGTTFGHSDDTFGDPVFINMVSNGILWASGRLR